MEYRLIDDEYVWNVPLQKERNSQFLQSWWWGVFHETFGKKAWRFHLVEKDNVVGAIQVMDQSLPFGLQSLYAPRGPIFFGSQPPSGFFETVPSLMSLLGAKQPYVFLRLEPTKEISQPPQNVVSIVSPQPQDEMAIDVSQPEEDLFSAMHEKTRYNIKLATKHGVRTRLIEDAVFARRLFPRLWPIMETTAQRQKIRLHPRAHYERMIDVLMPKGFIKLMIADQGQDIVAVHFLSVFGDTVYYLHGGSDYAHRQMMAPHALHWDGIKLTKKLEKTFYNLGGASPENAKDHSWANLTRFKEGFGSRGGTLTRFHYPEAVDVILKPRQYQFVTLGKRLRKFLRRR